MADAPENVFGKIAITHKFMDPKQVNECLDIQARMRSYGLETKKIGEIAVERSFITRKQLDLILSIQRAILDEKRRKEEALRPKKAVEPARPATRAPRPAPPPRRQPQVQHSHVPAARSKIDEYAAQIKMNRITTIVCLGIVAIVVVIILASLKNRSREKRENTNPYNGVLMPNVDPNAGMALEHERVAKRRIEEAERLYQELKEWAAANKGSKDEIIKRANTIAVDYAETDASSKARLLADFYADLPDIPQGDVSDQKKATSASQMYMKLSMEALKLRSQEQWAKAVEVYEQFPETYKDTPFYPKVRNEIKKLRQQIAKMYEADLHTINRLIAARKYDEARKFLAKIENYASHEHVIAVQRELDSYISEASQAPEPASAEKPTVSLAVEKLRVAESMFWRNMYADALKAYTSVAEDPQVMSENPQIKGRIKDLERSLSVLDAVKKELIKSKGRKRKLYLEKGGSISAEIIDIDNYIITVFEKNSGNSEIGMSELTTNFIMLHAKRILPSNTAETELALGTFLLSRQLAKDAEKHFYNAAKKNAPNEEIARMLERLEEKPPASTGEGIAAAEKPDEGNSENELKSFNEAEALFKKGKYAEALTIYKELLRLHLGSKTVMDNRSQIDEKIAACEERLVSPLASIFSGKVIERNDLGKGVVEVSYDFGNDKQLADWKEYNWYSIFDMHDSNWHIADGELSGNGSRGFLWKGIVDGDVKVEFDAYSTSAERQNIQATVCDNGEGWNYLFALGLTELGSSKDIIRRNEKFSFGKEIAKRPSEAKSFNTYHVKILRQKSNLSLYVDDKLILKAKHSLYKKGHVGLFAIGSTVRFDNISIVGRLDRQWLSKQGE